MLYENYYQFAGMHVIWWIVWLLLLFRIFAVPFDIPGQRKKRSTPLDILKQRFVRGEITAAEFEEKKRLLLEE